MSHLYCSNCKINIDKQVEYRQIKKQCAFVCNGKELCVNYLLSKEFEKYLEVTKMHSCINFNMMYLDIIRKCPTLELFTVIFNYIGVNKLLYFGDEFSFL